MAIDNDSLFPWVGGEGSEDDPTHEYDNNKCTCRRCQATPERPAFADEVNPLACFPMVSAPAADKLMNTIAWLTTKEGIDYIRKLSDGISDECSSEFADPEDHPLFPMSESLFDMAACAVMLHFEGREFPEIDQVTYGVAKSISDKIFSTVFMALVFRAYLEAGVHLTHDSQISGKILDELGGGDPPCSEG